MHPPGGLRYKGVMNDNALKQTILRHDRPLPRYTSYPTAPRFAGGFDAESYAGWLAEIPAGGALSLYLHVPFCPKLCWFCGCHTKITQRYAPVEDYTHLMLREIDMTAPLIPAAGVSHIHFGGGSPSMLLPDDFSKVMERLRTGFIFNSDAEIAIEIDPRQAGLEKIAAYAANGVNRVSFGVQDFDQTVLAAVNRVQPFDTVYRAVSQCRDHGITGINMDFMYGLPHQTTDSMRRMIDQAATMMPDRISLFGYAHVPWMKKHMRLIPAQSLPGAAARYDLFAAGVAALEANGYKQIGIDHFVRPGDALDSARENRTLRRNFQGYTTDTADSMIGFGISAIGRLPNGYVQNTPHSPHYSERILGGQLPVEKSCALNDDDRLRAAVIEELMCYFTANIPPPLRDALHSPAMETLLKDGLVRIENGSTLTIKTPLAARMACALFDAYLPPDTQQRHAAAV